MRALSALLAILLTCCAPANAGIYGYPKAQPTVPPTTIYLGAYVNPNGVSRSNPAGIESEIESLETSMGRNLALSLHFYPWKSITTTKLTSDSTIQGDITHHRVPVISWRCGDAINNVSAGLDDTTIKTAAVALQKLGVPVFVRWFWEFNLNTAGQTTNSQSSTCFNYQNETVAQLGADFIAAWEHIVTVFRNNGATNVKFLWCVAGGGSNLTAVPLSEFLPPSSYIDWLGFDAYDHAGTNSFQSVMDAAYQEINGFGYNLPILYDESGELENNGAPYTQAQFLTDAGTLLQSTYPQIKGFMYFDAPGTSPFLWQFDSGGLAQWVTLSGQSYFSAFAY